MVQFYPKAVSKSYWKRMDAESKDVPRGACLTLAGMQFLSYGSTT